MRCHRITKPNFRSCSACLPHSQAPLCFYTLRTIANRTEGTFGSLRYSLGGDRPSQTTHHTMSSACRRIRVQQLQGRYFKGDSTHAGAHASMSPAYPAHADAKANVSCSKGSRGLSVPLRVIGVITDTTISPSSWPRQCSSRYTIRAGRNLPDKEFRYLRTVIVTAAVYRGFSQERWGKPLTPFFNLPAPGRCQSLYIALRLSRDMCF